MPVISVIVPVYNAEKYLHRCIDSILAQTFTDFELLLINDGSKDGSGAICDEYAQKDSRVRVFHKENGGVSSARNVGLDNAQGEWVCFVDSDDELIYESLDILLSEHTDDTGMIMGGYTQYSILGNIIRIIDDNNREILSTEEALCRLYESKEGYQGYLWNKLFKMSIIYGLNLRFNTSIYFNEDRLFIFQYIARSRSHVNYIHKTVYKYILRENGAMNSLKTKYNKKYATDFYAYIMMKEELKNIANDKLNRLALDGICFSYIQNHNLMASHNEYDKNIHRDMIMELYKSGAFIYYIARSIREFIRQIVLLLMPKLLCKTR